MYIGEELKLNNKKANFLVNVSAVLIVKNEQEKILACLESIKGIGEIIIVVDEESSDDTEEISRKYADIVVRHKWEGYSAQKNFANSLATKDWILSIDADERVSPQLKAELETVFHENDGSINGYWVPHLDFMFGAWIYHGGWTPQYHLRLFHRTRTQWSGDVHEFPVVEGQTARLKYPLLHFSHDSMEKFLGKLNHYTSIEGQRFDSFGWLQISKMIFLPPIYFVYRYFYRLGFLDGMRGFVLAVNMSFYRFSAIAKGWEYVNVQNSQKSNEDRV